MQLVESNLMNIKFDILESNSNRDGDGVVWVKDDGIEVDWGDSVGVVEAMDLGSDTMKDLELEGV